MNVTVNRKSLIAEMTIAGRFTSSTIPTLKCARLRSEGGKLTATTTDLGSSVSIEICPADLDRTTVVPVKPVLDGLRALSSDQVTLLDDADDLRIVSGSKSIRIPGFPEGDFPVVPRVDEDPLVTLPFDQLKETLKRTLPVISQEESRFQLSGGLFELGDAISVVATDGHRLALDTIEVESREEINGIVPRTIFAELARLKATGDADIAMNETHVSIKVGPRTYTGRLVAGTFPQYGRIFADLDEPTMVRNARAADLAETCRLAMKVKANTLALTVNGSISVKARDRDIGIELADEIEAVEVSGHGEVTLGLNPSYLSDAVKACGTKEVSLHLTDKKEPVLLLPVDGGIDHRHVIMPVRL